MNDPTENNQYLIRPSRLEGRVKIDGAKNSALKLLAASILTADDIKLNNFPSAILDAQVHVEMLRTLGKRCQTRGDQLLIQEPASLGQKLSWEGRSIRNTLLILGALVARTGAGMVPLPGGCQLGERRYDLHEMLLRSMGADVWVEGELLCATVNGRLKGTDIFLPIRSTGATENSILCGCLAEGLTRVWNPHVRPEILDLINLLRAMGASISVFGQERIEIEGKEGLYGAKHSVVPDNMEAITWLIGSVISRGDVEIVGFPYEHLEIPLVHLRESGAKFFRGDDALIVRGGCCYPVDISTGPYPGINSDMQPLFAVFGFAARGQSRIIDLRFPGRYAYADEIRKMGGQFEVKDGMLCIKGGRKLIGSRVRAIDLRAGAALALAGLIADGQTVIEDCWQIDRGYNDVFNKMKILGADIEHVV